MWEEERGCLVDVVATSAGGGGQDFSVTRGRDRQKSNKT